MKPKPDDFLLSTVIVNSIAVPKLSVIVPVYNVEPYLERCLDSIIQQSFRDMEIICVNDGSTDGSLAILARYALTDDRIIVIDQKNQGLSSARNAGLDKAIGEYVLFVDSDDELAPQACSRLVGLVKPEHDAIMFGTSLRCADGSEPPAGAVRYLDIPVEGHQFVDDSMLVRLSVNAWNKMYRREAIERFRLRFPLGCLYEDAVFFYCFFSVCRSVYFIKDELYIYYRRDDSIMGATRQKKENHGIFHIFLFDWIFDFWNTHGVFHGREDVFCERFTLYIKLAFNSAPEHEKARCVWEATRRIRAWGLDTSGFPLLERLKNGRCSIALMPRLHQRKSIHHRRGR